MKPRMILTDLDGTLLRDDKSVSPAAMAALRRASEAGAEAVLATGRFFAGIPQKLRDLPFLRYFILMNGAKIYDRQEDRTVYRAEISLEEGEKIFDLIQPLDAMVDCYQNDRGLIDQKYYQRLDYYVTDLASRTIVKNSRTPQEHFREAVRQGGTIQKIQCFFPPSGTAAWGHAEAGGAVSPPEPVLLPARQPGDQRPRGHQGGRPDGALPDAGHPSGGDCRLR